MKRKPILFLLAGALILSSVSNYDAVAQSRERDKYGKRADDPVSKLNYAQKLRWADVLFKDGSFANASEYYDQLTIEQPRNPYLKYQLAECLWRLRDYEPAAKGYGDVYGMAKAVYPEAKFKEALMLKMSGEYERAIDAFQKFISDNPKPSKELKPLVKESDLQIKGCKMGMKSLENPEAVTIAELGTNINSVNTELSPIPLGDTALLFSTMHYNRQAEKITNKKHEYTSRFMVSRKDKFSKVDTFTWPLPFMDGKFNDPKFHVGNGSFTEGGDRFYFTKCLDLKGDTGSICRIYVSEFENDRWGNPQELGFGINETESSSTHPFFAKIGKKEVLFFSSNRKLQGRGGFDIWYSVYDSRQKTYRRPQNIGKQINTKGNEITPFFDTRTNKLYFSSDGWVTMGGYDVFEASMAGNSPSRYSAVKNMGYPINTPADDMYFVLDPYGKPDGYVVSNRIGTEALKNPTCCDDIFRVQFEPKLKVLGRVIDVKTQELVKETVVKMVDETGKLTTFNSTDGRFEFNTLREHSYSFTADKPKYTSSSFNVSTEGIARSASDNTVEVDLYVNFIDNSNFRMDNVFYDFNEATLRPESVTDLEKLIDLMRDNPSIDVRIFSYTDGKGTANYNEGLSQRRAQSVVDYLINNGGIAASRLSAEGMGDKNKVAQEVVDGKDNPAGRQLNRRTEFKIFDEEVNHIIFDSSKPGTIGSQEKNLEVNADDASDDMENSNLSRPGSRVNR
ncbi:MAG TPA: OmpA family protein [Edaphocola sp.]|nr:OmpA family protein [Edaphocola sp.]